MPLPVTLPYDTLATVTQLVRTVLADYVAGINPNVSGTVTTNGTVVTWASGNQFTYLLAGAQIIINGLPYTVLTVTSATTLTLFSTAGVQAAVAYSAVLPTGDIFADSQAYVVPTINLAWRKFQKKLDYSSHPRMRNEAIIFNLPVVGSQDPAAQQFISWTQFFDGLSFTTTPTLPSDFLSPLRLYERPSAPQGVTNTRGFVEMHPATDGLPARAKGFRNKLWDWREDALWFNGSLLNLDIRAQYTAFLPDIVVGSSFAATIIPIMRSADALAYYAAEAFVVPRGGAMVAPSFAMKGDEATDALTNRQAKLLQRGSYRRRAVYDSSRRLAR